MFGSLPLTKSLVLWVLPPAHQTISASRALQILALLPLKFGFTGILGWSPANANPVTSSSASTASYALPRGTLMVRNPAALAAFKFSPISSRNTTSPGSTPSDHPSARPRSVPAFARANSSTRSSASR